MAVSEASRPGILPAASILCLSLLTSVICLNKFNLGHFSLVAFSGAHFNYSQITALSFLVPGSDNLKNFLNRRLNRQSIQNHSPVSQVVMLSPGNYLFHQRLNRPGLGFGSLDFFV